MPGEDWQTEVRLPGLGGIDLKRELDVVQPLKSSRLTNLRRRTEGGLEVRPGQQTIATAGTKIHSIFRLNDPIAGIFTRAWGVDDKLYLGIDDTSPLKLIVSGFSGRPLTAVAYRPPQSSKSWLFVGDSKKMVKVRADGTVHEIGLKQPDTPPVTALAAEELQIIERFDAPSSWTPNAGTGGAPGVPALVGSPASGMACKFTTNPGTAKAGYFNFWAKALSPPVNLNVLGPGGRKASDDDQFQLWVKMDRPDLVSEIKVYLVISANFDKNTLPGSSLQFNTDAYFKSFRPSDFTDALEQVATGVDATGLAQTRDLLKRLSKKRKKKGRKKKGKGQEYDALQDMEAALSLQAQFGRDQWIQLATIGFPLRRGEFLRIGTDGDRNWDTATGVVVVVNVNSNEGVVISLDDFVLTGGAGPDSSEPGSTEYEYIYRHRHLLTGAKSNMSPEQTEDFHLDALRRAVKVTPIAYGDSYVRQEFFRRGGTLVRGFYFVGANEADGAAFTDYVTDAAAVQSGLAEYDNGQPVSTVAEDGSTVKAQPLRSIFGPIRDTLLACGDPYRPGEAYWCKTGEPDHWPTRSHAEVCAPSEELLGGCIYDSQAFVFSRARLHLLSPNFAGTSGVNFIPNTTECDKGTVSPWSFCVTPYGIAFVSFDGVWITAGGKPLSLSDDDLWGLFNSAPGRPNTQPRNGYYPVDWEKVEAIRLAYFDNELWLTYVDTQGLQQTWVFYFSFKTWRNYEFGRPLAVIVGEEATGGVYPARTIATLVKSPFIWLNSLLPLISRRTTATVQIPEEPRPDLLLGGLSSGRAYAHDGFSDDGLPIHFRERSGALNQGMPRENKIYGDVIVDADRQGVAFQVQAFVNEEALAMVPASITADAQADPI